MQKRITLSVDDKVYAEFQKFCEDNDIIISKRVERLMIHELEENKKGGAGEIKKGLNLNKDISKGDIVLLVIPNSEYTDKVGQVSKYLSGNYKAVCYVSLNKLITSLEPGLKKAGAKTDKFMFIDGITKSANPDAAKGDNVLYVQSAGALTEMSLTISKVFATGKFDVLFFDSLSSLLVYNKAAIVGKFIQSLINKLKQKNVTAVFTALKGDTDSGALKEVSLYVDKTINV